MTLNEAQNLRAGQLIYSTQMEGSDKRPLRAKVTSVKTWATRPERVEIRVKRGLKDFFRINEQELINWDPSEAFAAELIRMKRGRGTSR